MLVYTVLWLAARHGLYMPFKRRDVPHNYSAKSDPLRSKPRLAMADKEMWESHCVLQYTARDRCAKRLVIGLMAMACSYKILFTVTETFCTKIHTYFVETTRSLS
jgi:hypothetical protein